MKYTSISGAVLALIGGLTLSSNAAWAIDRGEMLANTCVGCHGPGGSSTGPATPNIAGLEADTMQETMLAYKEGDRVGTIMNRIAKGYSEDEIKAMSAYFAKQPLLRPVQEHDATKAEAGKKLHKEYCEKCHEEGGTKDSDGSAILAGQWLPYLQYQFADYASEERTMSKKMRKRMEAMLEEHGDKAIDQVSHFYASQK